MSEEVRDLLNSVTVILFATFLISSVAKMTLRLLRHRWLGYRPPLLLYRDVVLLGVLSALIIAPAIFNLVTGNALGDESWWIVLRSILGVSAVAFWWWVEFFLIKRNGEEAE